MAVLKFKSYTPGALAKYDEKALRREYSRLRSTAKKALERLEAAGYTNTNVYRLNINRYITLDKIGSKKDLISRLSDVSRFVSSRAHMVRGQKAIAKERIATLHEHGYTFVNESNIREFGNFINFLKALFPKHPSADEHIAQTLFNGYRELRKKNIEPEQLQVIFEEWMEKNTPDVYYLKPPVTDIPENLKVKTPWG